MKIVQIIFTKIVKQNNVFLVINNFALNVMKIYAFNVINTLY